MGAGSSCKCDGKTESPGTPVEVVTIKDEEKHRENERSSPRGEVPSPESRRTSVSSASTVSRPSVDKILSLRSAKLMRGISVKESLRRGGRLWRTSPIDLPEKEKAGLWSRSRQVDYFDMFLSHTWATRGSWKYLSLSFQQGWAYALLSWLLLLVMLELLCCFSLAPVLGTVSFGVQNFDAKCPFSGLGILVAMPVSVLAFFLAPYIPDVGKKQSCFLDVVSINQCDAKMMQEGIYGLGGFLSASKEMRILYSRPYLSRLWCIFELAAFRTANPTRRIRFVPLFVELGVAVLWLGGTLAIILYIVGFLTNFRGTVLLVVALLPLLGVFHLLRQNLSRKRQVFLALASFELSDASCRLASDQEFIYSAIQKWYGSLDAFTAYVRGPLRDELLKDHLGTNLPWYYGMLITTPWISLGMDALAALVRGDAPLHAILAYGIAMTLGLFTLWWLFTMQFLLLLCHRCPSAERSLCSVAQSLILFLLYLLVALFGVYVARWASNHSVGASFIWCGAAGLLVWLSGGGLQRWQALFREQGVVRSPEVPNTS